MAASLELRVPFLDVELMRFVERIPASTRVRPRGGKRLHRMAMERLLPPGIADRPKHGFSTPYDAWLRSSLGHEVERRFAPGTPMAELVSPQGVRTLVGEHRRGRVNHKSILYCLLELSEWHRAFVEIGEPAWAEPHAGAATGPA
jgi:asparagine synthase (glutamine-hydrolysing)